MRKLVLLLSLLFALPSLAHKFYVTIAEMEFDAVENRIKVSLKMTAHDFEHVLEDKFDGHIHIEKYDDSTEVIQYAVNYLKDHFKLFSADKQCDLNYLGKEVTLQDDLFFYFTFTNIADPSTVKIVNTLLFSLSDQQQNIVHYSYKDQTKSVTLKPAQSEAIISFE
ncbi:MAG: hypothetical protein H6582_00630 [Crocinitomicaceae bacterium]|nr:hypothetical protein [Crocinitomicaceae bacterium]